MKSRPLSFLPDSCKEVPDYWGNQHWVCFCFYQCQYSFIITKEIYISLRQTPMEGSLQFAARLPQQLYGQASTSRAGDNAPPPHPLCFLLSSRTRDFKIGTLAASLRDAWRFAVCGNTGWSVVRILYLGEVASFFFFCVPSYISGVHRYR